MATEILKVEMVWNEANMFARDLISDKWLDRNWSDLPDKIKQQFGSLVSEDIPREAYLTRHRG